MKTTCQISKSVNDGTLQVEEHSFINSKEYWTIAWTIKFYHYVKHQNQWEWEFKQFIPSSTQKFVHKDIKLHKHTNTNIFLKLGTIDDEPHAELCNEPKC